ncbi:MAG: hypothetical protein SOX11_04520 [Lachnospiraceae bacterium]|nr:hypothetical protein [Lachnospiraceae bacterium]
MSKFYLKGAVGKIDSPFVNIFLAHKKAAGESQAILLPKQVISDIGIDQF